MQSPTTSQNISASDLLFYRAGHPEALVAREAAHWDPVVFWAAEALGAHFILAEGVMHVRQPDTADSRRARGISRRSLVDRGAACGDDIDRLGAAGAGADPWRARSDQVWAAAHVDEDWNIEKWGIDEEVAARRAARLVDFRAATQILAVLKG